jgi:hypothetical protein
MSMPDEPSSGGGGGNIFMRKIGPLPMWGWMGIALALALMFHLYEKHKAGSSGTSNATSTGSATDQSAGGVNSPGGVDSSLVPQFVNQTYVDSQPPVAPNVTVNNTVPAPPVVVTPTPPPAATPAPAKTISGAPGSYTTGVAGGLNEWTSTGKYSINTIAKSHGMTAQQLIASSEKAQNNPSLAAYVKKGNLNAMLPAGVEIFIPNANWKTT